MVIREVIIPTADEAGAGEDFAFPAKVDYKNPIHAIFNITAGARFKFETKDGAVSVHPNATGRF